MLISLIYVSSSLIPRVEHQVEIDRIVTGSIERNGRSGVRGALIFTELHFAQLIEGPQEAVQDLMIRISRDHRHEKVTVIERKPIDGYHFADWSLAYWGAASYMDQKIASILARQAVVDMTAATVELYDIMRLLSQESRTQDGPIGRPSPHS